jgi:ribosome-associated translation inhibitor RaiA
MTHTQIIQNVPIYIHTHGTEMNNYLSEKANRMGIAITELTDEIVKIDLRLTESPEQVTSPRKLAVLVTLNGAELTASDSGKQWKMLFKHVEKRITRQIAKRKELVQRKQMIGATVAHMQTSLRA